MRRKNDINEFKQQQDAEIMQAYRRLFREYGGRVDVHTLYEMVSKAPASRFFVSELQAYRVIHKMKNGENMYNEIFRRVSEEIDIHKSSNTQLKHAVSRIVRQPAPEMYIGVRQVSFIISEEKRKCYEERKRRLRHCF